MAHSSILGGASAPSQVKGRDIDALGPSDSTDSGSDVQTDMNRSALPDEAAQGAIPVAHGATADAAGTGERASVSGPSFPADIPLQPDPAGTAPSNPEGLLEESQAAEDLAQDEGNDADGD